MDLVVVCPHFAPDVAPTGAVITRIVEELAARDHRIEVITALPWYRDHRIEEGYEGRLVRREDTPWGRITRLHPFPTSDKQNILRRAAAFGSFSTLAAAAGLASKASDGVLAMSPPLTLGLSGWATAKRRSAPLVLNVQDIYPDVAVELGALKSSRVIATAYRLERLCYRLADAVTVLSDDLKDNLSRKIPDAGKIRVIPNFVDTNWIVPMTPDNSYRKEFGLQGKRVVMYAGNVGLSQSLDVVIDAARAFDADRGVVFVINGGGAARAGLEADAHGLDNVRFIDMQPAERLPEVLAAADVHLVPLKPGLAHASVPSKTYSILAAGRPLVAGVDAGSEVARVCERSGGGIAVPPGDKEALLAAVRRLVDDPREARRMGERGRAWVETWASPAAVAGAYEMLFTELAARSD